MKKKHKVQHQSNLDHSKTPTNAARPTGGFVPDFVLDDLQILFGDSAQSNPIDDSKVPVDSEHPTGGFIPNSTLDELEKVASKLADTSANPYIHMIKLLNIAETFLQEAMNRVFELCDDSVSLEEKLKIIQEFETMDDVITPIVNKIKRPEAELDDIVTRVFELKENVANKSEMMRGVKQNDASFNRITQNAYASMFHRTNQTPQQTQEQAKPSAPALK